MTSASLAGTTDRFGVTLLFSLIAHAVLALGLTFEFAQPAPKLPTLDVTLLQSANGEAPEHADFLAQASNSGGGDSERAKRPAEPVSSPVPKARSGASPVPLVDASPRPSAPAPTAVLTQVRSPEKVANQAPAPDTPDTPAEQGREFEQRKAEMARLATAIARETEQYAKRPKKKYISANTKEYAFAAYMRAWVDRIERIGNLNYPDEARRRQLHGQLVLTVGLDRGGRVRSIDVIQSSGHRVLDDAARRIVELAAPFPPVPESDGQVDELYITRTWQFLPGDILRNR